MAETTTNPQPVGGNLYKTQRNLQLAEKILKAMTGLPKVQYEQIMKRLRKVGDKKTIEEAPLEMKSAFELAKKYEGKTFTFEGISTGMDILDSYLLGLKTGDVVVVGAYTGLGKSTVTTEWCLEFAKQGINSCMFFMEDSEFEAGTRINYLLHGQNITESACKGKFFYYPMEYRDMFCRDKFAFMPAVEAIVIAHNLKVVCLDMLNDIIAPVNDRDADDFMVELKSMADRLGIIFITTARLREPKSTTERGKLLERYRPDEDALYGRSMIKYLATKIITISPVNGRPVKPSTGWGTPELQYLGFHVMKNRTGKNTKQSKSTLVYELARGTNYIKFKQIGEEEIRF